MCCAQTRYWRAQRDTTRAWNYNAQQKCVSTVQLRLLFEKRIRFQRDEGGTTISRNININVIINFALGSILDEIPYLTIVQGQYFSRYNRVHLRMIAHQEQTNTYLDKLITEWYSQEFVRLLSNEYVLCLCFLFVGNCRSRKIERSEGLIIETSSKVWVVDCER